MHDNAQFPLVKETFKQDRVQVLPVNGATYIFTKLDPSERI